jgi:hypothetical protein
VRRFAVAWLLAIAAASPATPAYAHKCAVADVKVPAQRIDAILAAPDINGTAQLLAELVQYWRAHCGVVRENADAAVVRQLSRLLSLREARFNTSAMLLDVGENLPAARSNLDSAYADERRRYEEVSATYPANPTTLDALTCLREKLATGKIDESICGELLRVRNDA